MESQAQPRQKLFGDPLGVDPDRMFFGGYNEDKRILILNNFENALLSKRDSMAKKGVDNENYSGDSYNQVENFGWQESGNPSNQWSYQEPPPSMVQGSPPSCGNQDGLKCEELSSHVKSLFDRLDDFHMDFNAQFASLNQKLEEEEKAHVMLVK